MNAETRRVRQRRSLCPLFLLFRVRGGVIAAFAFDFHCYWVGGSVVNFLFRSTVAYGNASRCAIPRSDCQEEREEVVAPPERCAHRKTRREIVKHHLTSGSHRRRSLNASGGVLVAAAGGEATAPKSRTRLDNISIGQKRTRANQNSCPSPTTRQKCWSLSAHWLILSPARAGTLLERMLICDVFCARY